MKRLGIVRLSAIGDVVHAMPLAMALRRRYPGARITWIVEAKAAPLLEGHPAVDDVLLFPRREGGRGWGRFLKYLRALRLDATVDPQGNWKSGLVGLLSGARVRAGLHVRDCRERANALFTNRHGRPAAGPHGVDRAFAAGGPLGVAKGPDEWGLRATDAEKEAWRARCREAGGDPDGRIVAMHLTDPDDARSWFAEAWAETARALVVQGLQVVLNGAAERRPLAGEIAGPGIFDLTGKDDLRGLVAQFASMAERPGNVLLSPDSGPLHIAVAVGLRVLCLSGPQDPARTGPRAGVSLTAWEGLPCAPCLERRCILDPPTRACMRAIAPARVVTSLASSAGLAAAPPR
ncbi:MAG TPA: glycosyltransferase family 9 protein [Planctomycetota bacterium]|nr:glycosyltransferase family 9 protein [Planctomycetota bacterium]